MEHTHHLPVITSGGNGQLSGKGSLRSRQRVVTRRLERRWQSPKDSVMVVRDAGGLAVHGPHAGAPDLASEGGNDALVAEADPENGDTPCERSDGGHRDSGVGGST